MLQQSYTPEIQRLVKAEKLQLLFKYSFPAVFVSILVSILLSMALWPVQDQALIINWLILLNLSSVLRLALFIQYRRKKPTLEQTLTWEKPYFITLLLSSSIWGIGSAFLLPEDSPYHQFIILFFLMGMVGGAIASYWAHRLLTLLTVAILIFPATIWLNINDAENITSMSIGISVLCLFICIIGSSKVLSNALTQNLLKNHELTKEKKTVEFLARKDALTNLYNRRAFYEQLNEIGAYCQRHNEAIAVIIADLDNFKAVNDKHGNAAGDEVLITIGKTFKSQTRSSDICARLGGAEFGIIIRSSNLKEASLLAEKLRREIESTSINFAGNSFNLTASFGVACSKTHFGKMVKSADTAMYRAKAEGKNRVIQAPEEPAGD